MFFSNCFEWLSLARHFTSPSSGVSRFFEHKHFPRLCCDTFGAWWDI